MNVHETVPVLVWADVDVGIADVVRNLNTIEGVRTESSCQGTLGEGGAEPYGPFVGVTWKDDSALAQLRSKYDVEVRGENWGYVYPLGAE